MTDYSAGLAPAGPGRIDAHVHLCQLSVRDQPWTAGLPPLRRDYRLDELRHWLAAADVQTAVLVQTVQVAAETPEMLAIADAADEIAGVVGWVDLCAADVAGRLASLTEGSDGCWLTDIRHGVQDEHDPDWLRPEALRGLQAIAALGLVYDVLVRSDQLLIAGRRSAGCLCRILPPRAPTWPPGLRRQRRADQGAGLFRGRCPAQHRREPRADGN